MPTVQPSEASSEPSGESNAPVSAWGLAVAMAVLAVVVGAALWGAEVASQTSNWILHSRTVQFETAKYFSLLQDVEIGQRSYVLTEDRAFLQPYEVATPQVAASLEKLKSLTADNPRQRAAVLALESQVDARLKIAGEPIALQDNQDHAGALAIVRRGKGKLIMEGVRESINVIEVEEARLLDERQDSEKAVLAWVRVAEMIGLPLLLLIAIMLVRQTKQAFAAQRIAREHQVAAATAAAAVAANKSKTNFLASMSHEIRTPLNGVIGNLELLALTEVDQEQADMLFDADKAAKSLLALIGNILDFSKIEAGKLVLERVPFCPSEIFQQAVDIVQSRARQQGIFASLTAHADVPVLVYGDPTRLRQILLNLLGNAIKFTAEGGIFALLSVQSSAGSDCVLRFDVHDSGIGFDHEAALRLFQPFKQNVQEGAARYEGTGLGLTISKSLIETFGGEIGCDSEPGQGSSFWFTYPVTVIEAAKPAPQPDFSQRKILVIGRHESPAQRLCEYFRTRGATVSFVDWNTIIHDGLDAVLREVKSDPDLAVIEVIDGDASALRVAHGLRRGRSVPLLLGTCETHAARRVALRSGCAAFIPVDFEPVILDLMMPVLMGQGIAEVINPVIPDYTSAASQAAFAGKTILVVEDRLVNQAVIQRQLKHLGLAMELASDGAEGLEKAKATVFDAVLCDISMPVMNGYQFATELRAFELPLGRRTPVIALTANAFRQDMDRALAAGMDDFLSKPVTFDRLAGPSSNGSRRGAPRALRLLTISRLQKAPRQNQLQIPLWKRPWTWNFSPMSWARTIKIP